MDNLEIMALACKDHEGKPGDLNYRNNNPGNLIYSDYTRKLGAIGSNRFAVFPDFKTGFNALKTFLVDSMTGNIPIFANEAVARGKTIGDMTLPEYFGIYSFIGWENEAKRIHMKNYNYAGFVASRLGVVVETKLKDILNINPVSVPKTDTKPMLQIFSQRDPRWANKKLGSSQFTIGRWGCLEVCITMGYDWFFRDVLTPDQIDDKLTFAPSGDFQWPSLSSIGLQLVKRIRNFRDDVEIKRAIADPNSIVFLQVEGNHWVFAIGNNLFGGYKILDPFFGDRATTSRYKSITGSATLTKK